MLKPFSFRTMVLKQLFIIGVLINASASLRMPWKFFDPVAVISEETIMNRIISNDAVSYDWTVGWYPNMPIDHFSYRTNETFKLR